MESQSSAAKPGFSILKQYSNPNGQHPRFHLKRGDIFDVDTEAIVVRVNPSMRFNLDEQDTGRADWMSIAGSNTEEFINAEYKTELENRKTRIAPASNTGSSNPYLIIMLRVDAPEPLPANPINSLNPNWNLRMGIWRVLDRAYKLQLSTSNKVTWKRTPKSIAFSLIGAGRKDYGYDNAAEQILSALQGWYTISGPPWPPHTQWVDENRERHPPRGTNAERLRAIPDIVLLVPKNKQLQPEKVELAWLRAWNRYVEPLDSSSSQRTRTSHIRKDQEATNDFISLGTSSTNGRLQVNNPPPINLIPTAEDTITANWLRANFRITRSGKLYHLD